MYIGLSKDKIPDLRKVPITRFRQSIRTLHRSLIVRGIYFVTAQHKMSNNIVKIHKPNGRY